MKNAEWVALECPWLQQDRFSRLAGDVRNGQRNTEAILSFKFSSQGAVRGAHSMHVTTWAVFVASPALGRDVHLCGAHHLV